MKIQQKIHTSHKRKVAIGITILVALIAAAGVFAYQYTQTDPESTETTSQGTNQPPSESNATTDSGVKNDSDSEDPADETTNETPDSPKTVDVVIVDASQYDQVIEVRGYADTIAPGTCTYTFKHQSGDSSFTRTSVATVGASTVSCTTVDIKRSDFSQPGTWNIAIDYKSQSGDVVGSNNKTFNVE